MSESDFIRAHRKLFNNRDEIRASSLCGCFFCLATFAPPEVVDWEDQKGGTSATALCPRGGIDSVIGSASGFPVTEGFLKEMNEYFF